MTAMKTLNRPALQSICRQFSVERLYLFGSATQGEFDPHRSDLDFLVTLAEQAPGDYADSYLGLARALENMFHRPVDLVTERSIRNPIFATLSSPPANSSMTIATKKLLLDEFEAGESILRYTKGRPSRVCI